MRFEHEITIPAPKEAVRNLLDDFEQAARCLPGVDEVHAVGAGQFDGRVRVKVGPLSFNIAGKASVEVRMTEPLSPNRTLMLGASFRVKD